MRKRWIFSGLRQPILLSYSVIVLVALCFVLVATAVYSSSAFAQESGVQLHGRTADEAPPTHWRLYDAEDAETQQRVTEVRGQCGFAAVPPGRYILTVTLPGQTETHHPEIEVRAGAVTAVTIDSGIELVDAHGVAAPEWPTADEEGRSDAKFRDWGLALLPLGSYEVMVAGVSRAITVKPSQVTTLTRLLRHQYFGSSAVVPGLVPKSRPPADRRA